MQKKIVSSWFEFYHIWPKTCAKFDPKEALKIISSVSLNFPYNYFYGMYK